MLLDPAEELDPAEDLELPTDDKGVVVESWKPAAVVSRYKLCTTSKLSRVIRPR
jgi:hypothetical protein